MTEATRNTELGRHSVEDDDATHPVVVAIGVSADGINALQRVLGPLSNTLKAVVLIVRHIGPAAPSLLSTVLGRAIKLPVKQAVAGEALQPGVVYVAPPDLHFSVVDGHVGLDRGAKVSFSRPSIDVLFNSVAKMCGARSVAVLLSGGGSDGANGLTAVRPKRPCRACPLRRSHATGIRSPSSTTFRRCCGRQSPMRRDAEHASGAASRHRRSPSPRAVCGS